MYSSEWLVIVCFVFLPGIDNRLGCTGSTDFQLHRTCTLFSQIANSLLGPPFRLRIVKRSTLARADEMLPRWMWKIHVAPNCCQVHSLSWFLSLVLVVVYALLGTKWLMKTDQGARPGYLVPPTFPLIMSQFIYEYLFFQNIPQQLSCTRAKIGSVR